jgi:hypothetical protein
MHWHVSAVSQHNGVVRRFRTYWTTQEAWCRVNRLEENRQSPFHVWTVEECESLECLVDALAC